PSEFPRLSAREVGAGRITERVLVDDGGQAVVRGYAWLDASLAAAVHPESIDGQSHALVPTGALLAAQLYFSDAACAQLVPLVELTPGDCGVQPAAHHLVTAATTLP